MSTYFPTSIIKEYFKTHETFSLSDDDLNKVIEIFWVFFNVYAKGTEEDLKPVTEISLEEQEKRMSICAKCPNYNKDDDMCKLCGCVVKNKIKSPDQFCPMNKWNMDLDFLKTEVSRVVNFIDKKLKDNINHIVTIEEHEQFMNQSLPNNDHE